MRYAFSSWGESSLENSILDLGQSWGLHCNSVDLAYHCSVKDPK